MALKVKAIRLRSGIYHYSIGVLVGIEGEDVVGDTYSEVGHPHGHRGALVACLHLTEEVILAADGHRDLLRRASRLGLGEGDDIVAETFGERGLAVFEVDVEVEVVIALRLLIGLPDVDSVAPYTLLVFPLMDPVEASCRLRVLVEDPHGEEEFVLVVLGKSVDLSFHDGDDGIFRLDRHLVFDTVGMAHCLGTFPQQEGDLVGDLSLEADSGTRLTGADAGSHRTLSQCGINDDVVFFLCRRCYREHQQAHEADDCFLHIGAKV